MAATFDWQILNIECYPQFEGQTNVVTKIYWKCTASQIEGDATYTEYVERVTVLADYVKDDPFTPYEQLTQEQVLTWVYGENNATKNRTEEELQTTINSRITPPIVSNPLPWNG